VTTLPAGIASVEDRWPRSDDVPATALGQVVLASHLLGSNRAIANFGGGNTSVKCVGTDHVGRELPIMWVKGSGSDLATVTERNFTPLDLEQARWVFELQQLSDQDMVAHLARSQLDPEAPRSSIEALLHAFIPAEHVYHTHPDAINALSTTRDGERLVAECFGLAAAWIPYTRPGFTLAKEVAEAIRGNPSLRLVVLAKHGLVVWGDSAEDAYRRTIEVINAASEFVNTHIAPEPRFGGPDNGARVLDEAGRRALLREILPALRGAVSSERAKVLAVDTSTRVQELVAARDAADVVAIGAACPDHLVHTKRTPLWVPFDPGSEDACTLAARIRELAAEYRRSYNDYFERHADADTVRSDPDPRVVLIQHVGLVGVGPSTKAAHLARDLYLRAVEVMAGAHALGGFTSLTPDESFAVEYWPLELYKLSLAPPPRELEGKVAVITGAAGGVGRAVVEALAAAGAHVVALDVDGEGAVDAVAALGERAVAVTANVTSEASVEAAFAAAVETFGGVDIVVSNAGVASSAPITETTLDEWERVHAVLTTGYFLVARAAFSILLAQDRGGSIVMVASKNAIVAGKNAAAYSTAKAAEVHLARCLAEEGGAFGIRVNTVNPDAIIQGSRIWNSSWREQRAATYGIAPEELEEHYRNRTTLGVNVLPEDVAQAVLHFASDERSGRSTGNILNVDGGVAAAYPR
jgi:rhamnulose-1-phosphate aldolase/alcohol dehydrogenase